MTKSGIGEDAIVSLDLVYEYLMHAEEALSSPEARTTLRKMKSEVITLMDDIPKLESDSMKYSRRALKKGAGLSFNTPNKIHNVTGSRAPLVEQRGNRSHNY